MISLFENLKYYNVFMHGKSYLLKLKPKEVLMVLIIIMIMWKILHLAADLKELVLHSIV